jgi:hypothetical protein
MTPVMTSDEISLFTAFLRRTDRYVEFGSGGSTYLAASLVKGSVTSIDSAPEWLEKVRTACAQNGLPVTPQLIHVDIGPVGHLGYPVDEMKKGLWPRYHNALWETPSNCLGNLYLVDGRFRVACFTQVLLRASPDAFIAIHDFSIREEYHVVREMAREVATADTMSIFIRKRDFSHDKANRILTHYSYTPY